MEYKFRNLHSLLMSVVRPMVESNVTPRFLGGSDGFGTKSLSQ